MLDKGLITIGAVCRNPLSSQVISNAQKALSDTELDEKAS